jgi:hypothetical protein
MPYEVLYNTCYGGFNIPTEVVHRVFQEYPPHTEIGSELFEVEKYSLFIEKDDPSPTDRAHFYRIMSREPFESDYDKLITEKTYKSDSFYVQHRTNKKIYFIGGVLSAREYTWRKHPFVIQCMREMDFIDKKFECSKVEIAEVPDCCTFSISEYDGMESVHIVFPYRRTVSELLQYIDDHDETKLSEVSRKLVSKEMKLSDISHY